MQTRTDIHRPSLMNPTAYTVLAVACVYTEENPDTGRDMTVYELDATSDLWDNLGRPTESTVSHHKEDTCDHCGARIKYACIVQHNDTGDILHIGRDCVGRFFNLDWSNRTMLLQAEARRRSNIAKFVKAYPEAASAIAWAIDPASKAGKFARELAEKAVINGWELSVNQVGAMVKAYDASQAPVTLPAGRLTITGHIVKISITEDPFKSGRWGKSYKASITVQDANGVKYYGSLAGDYAGGYLRPCDEAKYLQREISFIATIEPVSNTFARYSRPAKMVIESIPGGGLMHDTEAPEVIAEPAPEALEKSPAICSEMTAEKPEEVSPNYSGEVVAGVRIPSITAPMSVWFAFKDDVSEKEQSGDISGDTADTLDAMYGAARRAFNEARKAAKEQITTPEETTENELLYMRLKPGLWIPICTAPEAYWKAFLSVVEEFPALNDSERQGLRLTAQTILKSRFND